VDIVILLVFVSLVLVVAALLLFLQRLRAGDFEHGERLSLLPLADDAAPASPGAGARAGEEDGANHASR